MRIGEGWPIEISNSWSSPTWVVRILKNEGVPYVWCALAKVRVGVRGRVRVLKNEGTCPLPGAPRRAHAAPRRAWSLN